MYIVLLLTIVLGTCALLFYSLGFFGVFDSRIFSIAIAILFGLLAIVERDSKQR
jgi:hypothetical protein